MDRHQEASDSDDVPTPVSALIAALSLGSDMLTTPLPHAPPAIAHEVGAPDPTCMIVAMSAGMVWLPPTEKVLTGRQVT
jgi:hypothetical protein